MPEVRAVCRLYEGQVRDNEFAFTYPQMYQEVTKWFEKEDASDSKPFLELYKRNVQQMLSNETGCNPYLVNL